MADSPRDMRRVRLLLFPKFQLTLVAVNLGIVLVVSAIFWIEMNRSFHDLEVIAGLSGPGAEYYKKYLEYQSANLAKSLALSLMAGCVVCVVMTLFLSHRFAGPLMNLKSFFAGIAKNGPGPLPRIRFRQGDYLEEIPPLINRALDVIEKK